MATAGRFVRNKKPSVPLFRSSLTQSAVRAGPARHAQTKVTRLNVKNSCSPETGLEPKSVTNQRPNPATNSAKADVMIRNRKLAGFLAAMRSSLSATERNCIEGNLGFECIMLAQRPSYFRGFMKKPLICKGLCNTKTTGPVAALPFLHSTDDPDAAPIKAEHIRSTDCHFKSGAGEFLRQAAHSIF